MNTSLIYLSKLAVTILAICVISNKTVLAKGFNDSIIRHIEYPEWFIDSPFLDLSEALANAQSKGKKGLMLLLTTEGCSYCDFFIQSSLRDKHIANLVQKHFDTIGMEIFNDIEMIEPNATMTTVKQFVKKEGIEFSPTLLFFGDNGKRILRIVGYQSPQRFKQILNYLTGNYYTSTSLSHFIEWQTEKSTMKNSTTDIDYDLLKPDPLFSKPPYALERKRFHASHPLLILFEKKGCLECKDFHTNVLALADIRDKLNEFEVVRLDINDTKTPIITPNGKRLMPSQWYQQASFNRVPALLFFDNAGNEVLKTDALVLHQRMMNSINYMLEEAYKKKWTYQRFARFKAIEKTQKSLIK